MNRVTQVYKFTTIYTFITILGIIRRYRKTLSRNYVVDNIHSQPTKTLVHRKQYYVTIALMKSHRNECIFTENGFIYLFDKLSSDSLKNFWRCKYKRECKARVHTGIDSLEILKRINEHTHDSEAAKFEAMVAINRLKNRAAETMEPTSTVINECISGLSEAAKLYTILLLIIYYIK